ncbi:MAG: C-GCAxxG-C-C family protein [Firmicutes bacterium]|nr:C-GCAxxG-C-C family protein [Bacillota bacterium]
MGIYEEKASALFKSGYNCAQAVFLAFAEKMNIDRETAIKLSSSFGGGIGRMREVCGAVSGMCMVIGVLYGYSDVDDVTAKKEHYERIRKLAAEFKAENGSIICRELLGIKTAEKSAAPEPRTEQYFHSRPCEKMVADAAILTEEYINTH